MFYMFYTFGSYTSIDLFVYCVLAKIYVFLLLFVGFSIYYNIKILDTSCSYLMHAQQVTISCNNNIKHRKWFLRVVNSNITGRVLFLPAQTFYKDMCHVIPIYGSCSREVRLCLLLQQSRSTLYIKIMWRILQLTRCILALVQNLTNSLI